MAGTRTEKASRTARDRVEEAVLLVVLGYDDLLAPEPTVVRLPPVGRLTLGRAEAGPALAAVSGVDLGVRDGFASTRHAVIRRGDSDVLSDLDSTNGTYVNGARVVDHPLADGDLVEIGHTLLCYRRLPRDEVDALGTHRFGPTRTLSPRLGRLAVDLGRIAPSREPVLLLAESGAGKEVAARMVHALSGRTGELVALDGGALPEALFEATLLGHVRGAFTGATEAQSGAVQRAHGGTLFLDEVANLSPAAQAKLLRVWEDGAVTPIGGAATKRVDVRWIAATNGTLSGPGFRDDLRERMAGFVARLPALRERREDLGLLAAHLLAEAGARRASIEPAAARAFFSRPFAGNVRELRQALRSAVLLAAGEPFESAHLGEASPVVRPSLAGAPARAAERDEQKERLVRALTENGGNVVKAAAALSTHPRQIYRMLAKHGLEVEAFRTGELVCSPMDQLPPSVVSDRRRLQAVSELDFSESKRNAELDDLAELVAEVLDVPVTMVSIIDGERQRVPGASGLPEPFATTREVPLDHSLCVRVVESATSLVVYDAANDPRVANHPAIAKLGIGAYLGVPIGRSENGPLGTLCVMDDKKRSWTPRDLRLLQSLAGSADSIFAARRGQYSMGSFDRVFRGFVSAVPDPVIVTDGEGLVTHQNEAARSCLGADLTGSTWQKTLSALMLQADGSTPYAPGQDPLARAVRGETTRAERVRWGSTEAWYEVAAQPVREPSGRIIGAVSWWKDITAQQSAQQRLASVAERDELTGLENRKAFLASAEAALLLARRRRSSVSLLLADVDGLKPINDQLGHEGGDDASAVRPTSSARRSPVEPCSDASMATRSRRWSFTPKTGHRRWPASRSAWRWPAGTSAKGVAFASR